MHEIYINEDFTTQCSCNSSNETLYNNVNIFKMTKGIKT